MMVQNCLDEYTVILHLLVLQNLRVTTNQLHGYKEWNMRQSESCDQLICSLTSWCFMHFHMEYMYFVMSLLAPGVAFPKSNILKLILAQFYLVRCKILASCLSKKSVTL